MNELANFLESLENNEQKAFYAAFGMMLTKLVNELAQDESDENKDYYRSLLPHSMLTHAQLFEHIFKMKHLDFIENPNIMSKVMLSDGYAQLIVNSYGAAINNEDVSYEEALRRTFLVNITFVIGVDMVIDAQHKKDIQELEENIDLVSSDLLKSKLGL